MLYDISKPFPETLCYNGKRIALTLYYDRVLSYFNITKDDSFSQTDKLDIAFKWFVRQPRRPIFLKPSQKQEIAAIIISDYLVTNKKKTNRKNNKPLVDFSQDSEYIYASFMAVYGIDLWKQQGKMHWHKFYSLFQALPADSYIKQIMDIRGKTIEYNGKNMKQIVELQELQNYYALDVDITKTECNMQTGLSALFKLMESKAKGVI